MDIVQHTQTHTHTHYCYSIHPHQPHTITSFTASQLTIRRVNPEVDGDTGDSFVLASESVRLRLNLLPHLIEISELLPFRMEKLRPLCVCETEREKENCVGGCEECDHSSYEYLRLS